MIKKFKRIIKFIKVILTCVILALSIFLMLFTLNIFNAISLDFSFLENIPWWDKVVWYENKYTEYFNCILIGIIALLSYSSVHIILSMIPGVGKLLRKILKFSVGIIVIIISSLLLIYGVIGSLMSTFIPTL